MRLIPSIAIVGALAAALAGCKRERSSEPLTAPKVIADETTANLTMTERIRQTLMDDPMMSSAARNVTIVVDDGTVTLRGPVATEAESAAVEQLATEIAGEAAVRNELRVIALAPEPAPARTITDSAVPPPAAPASPAPAPVPLTPLVIVVEVPARDAPFAMTPFIDANGNFFDLAGNLIDLNARIVTPSPAQTAPAR